MSFPSWGSFYEHSQAWRSGYPIGGGLGSGAAWGREPHVGSATFGHDGPWERAADAWGGRFGTYGGFEPWSYATRVGRPHTRGARADPAYFRRQWMDGGIPERRSVDRRFWFE